MYLISVLYTCVKEFHDNLVTEIRGFSSYYDMISELMARSPPIFDSPLCNVCYKYTCMVVFKQTGALSWMNCAVTAM